jgi:glycosyltransferase involved in cell wall biosynthesis
LNEAKTIGNILQRIREAPYQPKEIIVVDDGYRWIKYGRSILPIRRFSWVIRDLTGFLLSFSR